MGQQITLEVICDHCGAHLLSDKHTRAHPRLTGSRLPDVSLRVEPCETCIEQAAEEGFRTHEAIQNAKVVADNATR